METISGPQARHLGKRDASTICTATRNASGQDSMGPSGVEDQSCRRTRSLISPAVRRKSECVGKEHSCRGR